MIISFIEHPEQYDEALTVQDVKTLMYVTTPTVYRLIREGKVKAVKFGKKYYLSRDSLWKYTIQHSNYTESEQGDVR